MHLLPRLYRLHRLLVCVLLALLLLVHPLWRLGCRLHRLLWLPRLLVVLLLQHHLLLLDLHV